MRHALASGIREFLEPGPGNVLAGLLRRITKDGGPEVRVRSIQAPADLDASA
jgi:malonyl CoA-acyl carrier protein transacylase